MILITFAILTLFVIPDGSASEAVLKDNKNIFCLHNTKSQNLGEGRFYVQNISDQYCTHLIYDYVDISHDGTIELLEPPLFDSEENGKNGSIRIFNEKKLNNTNLKTLVMFGGWNSKHRNGYYSHLFRVEENQERFVNNSVEFITMFNFDGLVLYWSWPGITDGDVDEDKKSLVSILKKLKPEMKKRNLLLVVFCHAYAPLIEVTYNVEEIVENVDYIFLLTYNYFGSFSSHIGIASGLYLHPDEANKGLSVNSGIKGWINLGAPPEKILMGIVLSGTSFTLENENRTKPGSPFTDLGYYSKYVPYSGRISYMELCQRLPDEGWTIKWEDTQKNPYAVKDNQWVGYENKRSLEFKAKYVIENNLAGIVIINIGDDDFRGLCDEKYALHRVLNAYLRPSNL